MFFSFTLWRFPVLWIMRRKIDTKVRLCVTHSLVIFLQQKHNCHFLCCFSSKYWNLIEYILFLVFVFVFVWNCFLDTIDNCSADFSGFSSGVQHLQAYANEQLLKSFDYLLLSANFGTYVKNRPGFEKKFRELSDTAWERSINLIKHITKRGGQHDFFTRRQVTVSTAQKHVLELNEINAMAFALDTEKSLSLEAHSLHERYSHANHKAHYDPEVWNTKNPNSPSMIDISICQIWCFCIFSGCSLLGREIDWRSSKHHP